MGEAGQAEWRDVWLLLLRQRAAPPARRGMECLPAALQHSSTPRRRASRCTQPQLLSCCALPCGPHAAALEAPTLLLHVHLLDLLAVQDLDGHFVARQNVLRNFDLRGGQQPAGTRVSGQGGGRRRASWQRQWWQWRRLPTPCRLPGAPSHLAKGADAQRLVKPCPPDCPAA